MTASGGRAAETGRRGALDVVLSEINRAGPISFHRFMELCLYHPGCGYYSSRETRLGRAGDYYTSAHTAPVFARLMARHLEQRWRSGGRRRIEVIELGPGDGLLAGEMLAAVAQRFPALYESMRYTAVEQSAALRERIEKNLAAFPAARVISDLEFAQFDFAKRERRAADREGLVCILANEFFDALPAHLLVWRSDGWKERYVCARDGGLAWREERPSAPDLAEQAESRFHPDLPRAERESGWAAEISPEARSWMRRIAGVLARCTQGELVAIDYGYTIDQWEAGRFPRGSAMAYRRHHAGDNLLAYPGEQDLTAHVNFTDLMAEGTLAGMEVRECCSQSKFLLALGEPDSFADVFSDCGAEPERMRRAQLLKTLITPDGMGEAFRVLRMESRGRRKSSD